MKGWFSKQTCSYHLAIFPSTILVANSAGLPLAATSFSTVDFSIFNRWGEEIYYSREIRPRWDGTFNGILSPNDIYTYKIQVVNILEELKSYTGHVTLWR